jgi:hypothetical protein
MKKVTINNQEIGLTIKANEVKNIYTKGSYWVFFGQPIEKFQMNEIIDPKYHSLFISDEIIQPFIEVIEVGYNQVLMLYKNNQYYKCFYNTNVMLWKDTSQLKAKLYDLSDSNDIKTLSLQEIEQLKKVGAIKVISVQPFYEALLFKDNQLETVLTAGEYNLFSNTTKNVVVSYDKRPQTIEILGQEILTKDKAQIRINFMVNYRIIDLLKAYQSNKDFEKMIYQTIQLGLREFIGNLTLDELMTDKNSVTDYILNKHLNQFEIIGLQLVDAGMKDIILPGEIREIMNRVLVAEKTAQANSIMRREETASTRSLLNTAKLMEENATLWKLKEMEYIEKIADKVGEISISGGTNVLNELKTMFTK